MQILNSGFGDADEKTIIRPDNPQRRDVMIMPPGSEANPSYLVIQWDADNPGVWPLRKRTPSFPSLHLLTDHFQTVISAGIAAWVLQSTCSRLLPRSPRAWVVLRAGRLRRFARLGTLLRR
jgi:hypothetical protein